MKTVLYAAPTFEPVTLAELKLHLRVDSGSFADNIDETQLLPPASHAVNTGYTLLYELMTLDVAPGGGGWAAGDTITGQTSTKTCKIVEVLSTTTYTVKDRSGTFTLGEILTNGVATADQGAVYPTFAPHKVEVLGYTAVVYLSAGTFTTGTVDCKIQDSDDGTTWTDWTGGAFTQVTTANDNATQEIAYTGAKRYIRTAAKVLVAVCPFSTSVIRLAATSIEDDLLNAIITSARENVEDITRRALITQTWDYYLDDWPDADFIKLPLGKLQSITSIKYKDTDGVETNMAKAITAFAASGTSPATKTAVTSASHGFSDGDVVSISGTTSYDGGWEISNVATNTFDILMVFVANDATGYASNEYLVETNGEGIGRVVLPYGITWPSVTLFPSNPIRVRFVCGWTTAALVPYKIKAAIKLICTDLYVNREAQLASGLTQSYAENKTVQNLLASARLWDDF